MNATLLLLALATLHGDSRLVVDLSTARRATTTATVVATAERMQRLAADGATDALVTAIRDTLADPALDPVAREWLMDTGLASLRPLPATPAAHTLARELAPRAPRVYTRIEPGHGRTTVPLYDVGASARFALREWARRDARNAAALSLRQGSTQAREDYVNASGADPTGAIRDGIADAFAAASTADLLRQRPDLIATIHDGRDADRLALVMARRLRDAELYALAIDHAEDAIALAAIQSANRELGASAALDVLGQAADRSSVASAALLALGQLATTEPGARQLLLERIADPVSGESAAAALAGIDDDALMARLGARMQDTKDEQTRRRLALALKLNGSEASRRELARLVAAKQCSNALRKEVAAWLERVR